LVDEIGIDITQHAGQSLKEAFGERMNPAAALVAMGESERLGRKGGLGFYRYEKGKERGVDPDVYRILGEAVPQVRQSLPVADIRGRLVLSMINEAARALDDGIVRRAAHVDLAMIMGTGFPPFRGGLLRYSDGIHIRSILAHLEELAEARGHRFSPAPLIRRLAEADQSFYQAFP
jgi:3-hydroxyacyl-CoA dehydrogenase/enoyl-CoA hydratase/3-hydroxybutyryl-CoA epimerase